MNNGQEGVIWLKWWRGQSSAGQDDGQNMLGDEVLGCPSSLVAVKCSWAEQEHFDWNGESGVPNKVASESSVAYDGSDEM